MCPIKEGIKRHLRFREVKLRLIERCWINCRLSWRYRYLSFWRILRLKKYLLLWRLRLKSFWPSWLRCVLLESRSKINRNRNRSRDIRRSKIRFKIKLIIKVWLRLRIKETTNIVGTKVQSLANPLSTTNSISNTVRISNSQPITTISLSNFLPSSLDNTRKTNKTTDSASENNNQPHLTTKDNILTLLDSVSSERVYSLQ